MFNEMQQLMDPSRNMSRYRNLVNGEDVQPPIIPFYPVVKKDLTFIHLANDSKVENLVNFEKLRMIAKEVSSYAERKTNDFGVCVGGRGSLRRISLSTH